MNGKPWVIFVVAAVVLYYPIHACAIGGEVEQSIRQDTQEEIVVASPPILAPLPEPRGAGHEEPERPQPRRKPPSPPPQAGASARQVLQWMVARVNEELEHASRQRAAGQE